MFLQIKIALKSSITIFSITSDWLIFAIVWFNVRFAVAGFIFSAPKQSIFSKTVYHIQEIWILSNRQRVDTRNGQVTF